MIVSVTVSVTVRHVMKKIFLKKNIVITCAYYTMTCDEISHLADLFPTRLMRMYSGVGPQRKHGRF